MRVEHAKGQVFRRDVSALGWPTAIYDPADTLNRFTSLRYDKDGILRSYTNRRSQRVERGYDALHRPTTRVGAGGVPMVGGTLSYNASGTKMMATNSIATDSVFTDSTGFVVRHWTKYTGANVVFNRQYTKTSLDELDGVTITGTSGITFPDRRYGRNAATRFVDTLIVGGGPLVTFTRNGEGLEATRVFALGG